MSAFRKHPVDPRGDRMIVAILAVALLSPGCFYVGTVKMDTGDPDLVDCDGTLFETIVELPASATDPCAFDAIIDETEAGSSVILTSKAPVGITAGPFEAMVDDVEACLAEGEVTDVWEAQTLANAYRLDFDETAGSCIDTCGAIPSGTIAAQLTVEVCDVSGDYAANPNAAPAPPWTPLEPPREFTRTGHAYSGQFSFAHMSRVGARVCAVLQWRRTPGAIPSFGYVLADEQVVGSTRTYTVVDSSGLYGLPASSTATLVPSGQGVQVSGTMGNPSLDTLYGLTGTHQFDPATGAGSGLGQTARRVGATVCQRLQADNP